jgi:excisionase family DNA binding protein
LQSAELSLISDALVGAGEFMVAKPVVKHKVAEEERASAGWVSELLAKLREGGGRVKLVVEPALGLPQEVVVDRRLAEAIRELSDLIHTGGEVSLFGDDPEISPEQASELLGISRPLVVQRIKQGDLRARMVGTHHRIRVSDLLAFRAREADREAAMAEFSELTDAMAAKRGS